MKRIFALLLILILTLGVIPAAAYAEEGAAVTAVTLDREEAQISKGMELTLEAAIEPNNAAVDKITWESSDPSVILPQPNGTMKAVGEGEATVTVTVGECSASCKVTVVARLKNERRITVPTGADAQLFIKKMYYSYDEIEPTYEVDNKNGTTTFYFSPAKTMDLSWRVTKEGMTTKAGYWDGNVEITEDSKPEQKNGSVSENSVLLNINAQNRLVLNQGDRYDLQAYRAWEIVDQITANYIIMPDFTYTIVSGSDVVELVDSPAPMNGSSCRKTIVAKGSGTAVIEVSYNAIDIFGGDMEGSYPACESSRKGLVVVQVGNAANVNFNIDGFSSMSQPVFDGKKGYIPYNSSNKKAWDAEFDTLYFTGTKGEIRFKPGGNAAYVSHDKGLSFEPLTVDDNGVYTADIVSGNNILKVDTGSGSAYQVVRGDQLQVNISKVEGSSTNYIQPGDTVRVYLHGLQQPFPKLAGIYNPGFSDLASGGSQHGSVHLNYTQGDSHIYGPGTQYYLVSEANYVDVKIPESAKESVILEDGYIGVGVFGRNHADGDAILTSRGHRSGEAAVFGDNSILSYHTRSILPEIEIELGAETENKAPIIDASKAVSKASVEKGKSYAIPNLGAWFSDPEGKSLVYLVTVDKSKETGISGSSYTYTADKEGTVELVFRATDGETFSEPHTLTLTVTKASTGSTDTGTGTGTGTGGGAGTNVTPGGSTSKEFGLSSSEIAGYVTISFEDNGVRLEEEKASANYPKPLGTIIPATKVPFKSGDTIADATLRLLDEKKITYKVNYNQGFYLSAIEGFEVNNTGYPSMGEFDAGKGSGWMVTWNGWFIDRGASGFQVKDGDSVRWQYTCQLGKDIGDPFYGDKQNGGQNGSQNNSQNESQAVKNAETLINALSSPITKKDEAAVKAASDAYNALSEAEKAQVDKALVQKLSDAKKTIGQLSTTASQKKEAEEVEKLISAIGDNVSLNSEAAVEKARQAYDKLTDTQKYLVENYDKLTAAEQVLQLLKNPIKYEDALRITGNYLEKLGTPQVGSIGGEWMVIGLARADRELGNEEAYFQNVLKFIQENINEKQQLHRAKSTENSRLIIALTALGKDPTNVGGHNLLLGLTDMEYVKYQGINGPIWALMAFDSGNYPVPSDSVSRGKLIDEILNAQLKDGGWALSGEISDTDMTAMALQALAAYYEKDNRVKAAVDEALQTLSKKQADDGTFATVDGPNCESAAQVIVALSALGIDADSDEGFVKNGVSAMDALLGYYISGGGFSHVSNGERDGMSTEQGYYALVAYERMRQGKSALYDMTDIVDKGGDQMTEEIPEPSPIIEEKKDKGSKKPLLIWLAVMSVCAGASIAIVINREKIFKKFM